MKRPWELAHAERRGIPRVYVPVTLPETTSATFAVLELVGFSSSPSPSLSTLHQPNTFISPPHPLFPGLQYAPNSFASPLPLSLSPHIQASNQNSHLPLSSEMAVAPPIAPPEAKKSQTPPDHGEGKVPIVKTSMKENVVHTTSLNFKDVVQKLTGASGKAEDMFPVTLPNRVIAPTPMATCRTPSTITTTTTATTTTTSKVLDALSVRMGANKVSKKSSSCKLLERRKGALRNLGQLHTEKPFAFLASALTSLSPSPITPLTSYFEKFCNAVTPTASQSSPSSNISSPFRSLSDAELLSNMPIIDNNCASSTGGRSTLITKQQCVSPLQTLCGPPLLSLFPESPNSSPTHL